MCLGCGRLWTALQVLWSTLYVTCGAAQLMAGIFFTISVPELHLYSILFAGSWNIIIGIGGGMVACISALSSKRQEILLYLAISILAVNSVDIILTEYWFYVADMPKILKNYNNHMLIEYACFVSRIATAIVLVVSFLDSQLTFCSMQAVTKPRKKKLRGSHEQVSDIEYIIPRPKSSKPHTHTGINAYAQSWVFDAENAGCSNSGAVETSYFKVLQNGTPKKPRRKSNGFQVGLQNGMVKESGHIIDNPVVHVEEASDDSTSNSDRKLCYMKSFSRSQSPVILSASSSQISLNLNQPLNPPIYECLEKLTEPAIYRSRLNTALSNREEEDQHYQAPQTVIMRRLESTSPHAEKVQYASLMKELQRAIVSKKEPQSVTSPQSHNSESATTSDKTQTSKSSSRSEGKSSDADFSKELEAALQLIQDLESPNTIETPSETKSPLDGQSRPLAVWRNSDASESSEKTLSAVGSLAEITSPLTECQPELYTFKPSSNGKGASVVVHYPDSQSTSGYSSPTHGPTPNWSTTSSINGSNTDIKPTSYSIHNTKSTTVISLYSPENHTKGKSITLVKITGDNDVVNVDSDPPKIQKDIPEIHSSTLISDYDNSKSPNNSSTDTNVGDRLSPIKSTSPQQTSWKLNSLLRKKKQQSLPKLCPELEGAIIKSESLAYLSDIELLARHQRNKELQREIEKRVVQKLGVPRTESSC
ncbi:uncharacterized protein LOC108909882 [Anoplophora glabripennis]|uniref:Uncharacterized protein n=1 Tax=Anoplophora glabripennis TaxID=217634 RepID=V5GXE5_ANOGL|nr:uncharacterized protein LOC108909882 [Anoplophora glabripennis]XP_018569845.1 uncharacterized protein LOC108909882 [Anoplophora glabripennis]XP_018569846.1 uncharacterized protein LOC108909882 [Anoplophora glabripennis]XP_018569847.1 uncharacterized protein LOC108909882 [Anoplophora glabripennis]